VWVSVQAYKYDALEIGAKTPVLQHGHVALSKALKTIGNQDAWIESLGDVGEALNAWGFENPPKRNRRKKGNPVVHLHSADGSNSPRMVLDLVGRKPHTI
jgi:hypothetical protein